MFHCNPGHYKALKVYYSFLGYSEIEILFIYYIVIYQINKKYKNNNNGDGN
jgi:hypothetical protein